MCVVTIKRCIAAFNVWRLEAVFIFTFDSDINDVADLLSD